MDSIGEKLRQERVRRGLDIEGIAERTKISPSLLQAIENNDLSKLPGSFFTRSFVRQYARALGLDDSEFASELNQVAGETAAPEAHAAPEPGRVRERFRIEPLKPSRTVHGGFVGPLVAFILVLAICSGVYSFWQKSRSAPSRTEPPRVEAKVKPQPAATAPAPAPVAETATPATQPETPPAAAPPAPSVPVRVEFRATEPAWVRITADGKVLFMGTIEAGQSQTFDATAAVRIRTGNAGGLEAIWNGKPTGPLGPAGQVRDIEFTPTEFHVVPPAPKPPAEIKPSY